MRRAGILSIVGLVCAAALSVLCVPPAAAEPAYTYDKNLRWWVHNSLEDASLTQGSKVKRIPRPVYVRCYTSRQAFDRGGGFLDARHWIAYYIGGGAINVRAGTCKLARRFTDGLVTQDTAGAFKTLLHEAIHRQGFYDERATEAVAVASMDSAGRLVDFKRRLNQGALDEDAAWGASAPAGARATRLAWQQSRRYAADEYLTSWPRIGWYQQHRSWSDLVDARD